MKVRTMGKIKGRNMKRYIAGIIAVVFACGTAFVPVGAGGFCALGGAVDEAYAVENGGLSGEYVEGEVIVCYVDSNDMNLTASQEKKAVKLEKNAETLMEATDVPLEEVDVDESKITKAAKKGDTVDETIALVESGTKTTEELIAEYSKLPNVASVEPNYIVHAVEGESVSAATEEAVDGTVDAGDEGIDAGTTESTGADSAEAGDGEGTEEADGAGNGEVVEGSEETVETASFDYTGDQWAYDGEPYGVNVPGWNTTEKNSEGTVVAVMDTGVDYNHEDLKNVMWKRDSESCKSQLINFGFGQYGINVVDKYHPTTDPMDDNYKNKDENSHGTHCAGIIAGEWGNDVGVSGIANGTKIMAVKALDNEGSGYLSSMVAGYDYIVAAKNAGVNIVSVNNSWAFNDPVSESDNINSLNLAVRKAGEAGIVSAFASGNSNGNCDKDYDGKKYLCYFLEDNEYAIVVNNLTDSGDRNSGSNYGKTTTHVFAPGTEIISTIRTIQDKNDPYDFKTGTSMATPAVSGEVAILAARANEYDSVIPADVMVSAIKKNVTDNKNLENLCESKGCINVASAISYVDNLKNDVSYRVIEPTATSYAYNGAVQKPTVTVGSLVKGEDYDITYDYSDENSTNAGTYKVTVEIKGKNGYGGEQTKTFTYTISKLSLRMSLSPSMFIYDGGMKSVSAAVEQPNSAGYQIGGTVRANLPGYYTVTANSADPTNVNAASATWRIAVKPTTIKKLSKGSKAFTVKVAKQGKKYVNGYQVQYSLYPSMASAKTKTIGTKYSRVSKKVSKLKKKKTYYVQVRTYKTISGKKYYSDWSAVKSVKTK